ncbi:hypothetical protein ACFU0X_10355 [Streptomyces cellulosae]|uniref:Uncharacterized protein n=1 Tax=Streptomyces cellulosae TaxID=1968 RepID=A0ABW6JES2_STRCE
MPGREPSNAVASLGDKILELLRQHPGKPYSYAMLGEALDVDHQKTNFRLALAHARERAAENGECVTACVWDRSINARALRFIASPESTSQAASLILAHTRRARNALAAHAALPGDDPLYGTMIGHATSAAQSVEQLALAALELIRISQMQAQKLERQQAEITVLSRQVRVQGITPTTLTPVDYDEQAG